MNHASDAISAFYLNHLKGDWQERGVFATDCPFCQMKGVDPVGKLIVILNPAGFFHGYFRCLSRCIPGGFTAWFATVSGINPEEVPGHDPDITSLGLLPEYPVANSNGEIQDYYHRLSDEVVADFEDKGIERAVLQELQVGFNGRYITYPYVQADGNCYSVRCVFPDRIEDFFWQGNKLFSEDPFRIFNVQDIERCRGGALFLCEGETNLLTLRQLGYPGVAVPHHQAFETIDPAQFEYIRTLFLVTNHCGEAEASARAFAARVGYKVRMLRWPVGTVRHYGLADLARDKGKKFRQTIGGMIKNSNAFSPFSSPDREYSHFVNELASQDQSEYTSLLTGFDRLDAALEGVHGLNVIGGAPKVGKSTFVIQVASQMAERGIPVLYYDFENGRQRIYQRILSRMSRLAVHQLSSKQSGDERNRYDKACMKLRKMMYHLRIVNDRKVTPELMRRHIDFIRHETRSTYTIVVIDSLHKLPFKDFSERRTGIDAWLRQLESIRDELNVSFLVISELSRGSEKAYSEEPHLGIFKGSGDIEYSADNAMVLFPSKKEEQEADFSKRSSTLWVVASREHSPGPVANYCLDYPYWGFIEKDMG